MLPSGDVVSAELVDTRDGVAIVELADHADSTIGPTLTKPADDWTVVAFGAEIRVSEDDELRTLAVPEAAPIFDADGNLVGLCTIGPNGVEMLPIDNAPRRRPTTRRGDRATGRGDDRDDRDDRRDRDDRASDPTDSMPSASTQPALPPVSGSSSPVTSSPTTPAPASSDVPATVATSEQVASSEPPTSSLP